MSKNRKVIKFFAYLLAIACLCIAANPATVRSQDPADIPNPAPVTTEAPANGQTTSQLLDPPPNRNKPIEVAAGIYITTLANIDQANENFDITGYLFVKWKDERLAFNPKDAGTDVKEYKEADIWQPAVEIVNIADEKKVQGSSITVKSDGNVSYQEKFLAKMSSDLNLKKFPFDSQKLKAVIESLEYNATKVNLVPDNTVNGWSKDSYASLSEWLIKGVSMAEKKVRFEPEQTEYARLIFEVEVQRNYGFYLWKVFIPLVLLVVISWTVFWIEPAEFGTQLSVSITNVLAVVAFSFTVNDALPRVGYLTFIDGFIFVCFAVVFISTIELVAVHYLMTNEKKNSALKLHTKSRWLFPVGFGIGNILLIIFLMFL